MNTFRRHARWCPLGQPAEGTRLDLFTDQGAFPVWEQAGVSNPTRLGVDGELAADLRVWADWADRHSQYGGGASASADERLDWDNRGLVLARRLAEATGAQVVYRWPHGPDGGDAQCPHCGERAYEERVANLR